MEYAFYGTGINLLARSGGVASTATIQIDGAAYTGAATAIGTGSTWVGGTSTFTMGAAAQDGTALQISGLTLGLHKIRVTVATNNVRIAGVEIQTPIHSPKSNLYADLQNTLSVGSQGIEDLRKIAPLEQITSQKAWVQAIGVVSSPTTTSTYFIPCPDMSTTIKTSGGHIRVSYSICNNQSINAYNSFQIYIDGIAVGQQRYESHTGSGQDDNTCDSMVIPVSPGVHRVDVYWRVGSGTGTLESTSRTLLVEEK